MIFITNSNISLLSFHIKQTYKIPIYKQIKDIKELKNCLLVGGELNDELTKIIPSVYLIDWEGNIPTNKDLIQSDNNITYIKVDKTEQWNSLHEQGLVNIVNISPLLYKNLVERFRTLFTNDSFDYFWEELCLRKFKSNPNKWIIELTSLLIISTKSSKEKFTLEDLERHYSLLSENLVNKYLINIGSKEGRRCLDNMTPNQLWTLYIGSSNRLPLFYKYLLDKQRSEKLYYLVSLLQLSVNSNRIDIYLGSLILDLFIEKLGLVKGRIEYGVEELKEFKRLIHLV